MGRPEKEKRVDAPPLFELYQPVGSADEDLNPIKLTLDEYEAVRLADYEELEHEAASIRMGISRPTFTKLITRARKKYSRLLIEGGLLYVGGGKIHFNRNRSVCRRCGERYFHDLNVREPGCPKCGAAEGIDLANRFGHGECCTPV